MPNDSNVPYGPDRPQSNAATRLLSSSSNGSRIPSPSGKKASSKNKSSKDLTKKAPLTDKPEEEIDVVSSGVTPALTFSHRNVDACPCGESSKSWKIDCSKCHQFWHVDCLSLKGLSEGAINKLVDYLCPFCYVSPVPTIQYDRDVCHVCKNTLTLQHANSVHETAIACDKLESMATFGEVLKKVDLDSLNDGLLAIQNLELHVKHLLISEEGLKHHQDRVSKIEEHLSKLAERETAKEESLTDMVEQTQQLVQQLNSVSHEHTQSVISSKSEEFIEKIEAKLEELTANEPKIENELKAIRESLQTIEGRHSTSATEETTPVPHSQSVLNQPEDLPADPKDRPIQRATKEFITDEEQVRLIFACQSLETEFKEEGGRAVCSLGEPYRYNGSRSSAGQSTIPNGFSFLVERINETYCQGDKPKINSLLINRYKADEGSLPAHSDDETTIHPESEIFTVSIGGACNIKFLSKKTGAEVEEHRCEPCSLYSMTRRSQEFFRHCIEEGAMDSEIRYSLTFRSVSFRNKNATCIIGDSHTGGLKFGTDSKKSFGKWLPGKQNYAPLIKDIDPQVSCGYRNIVVMCGINDLKQPEIKTAADVVRYVFTPFVKKIEQIQTVNAKAHLYVCPLLPTKLAELNRKVICFNRMIMSELIPSNFGVTLVGGFGGFCDDTGLLSEQFSRNLNRYQRPDYLHLNWRGTAKLAVLIRNTILIRLNGGIDKRKRRSDNVDERSYRDVAAGGVGFTAAARTPDQDGYQPF